MTNIKSMTGYGKAANENELRRINVEIKSLNSKQFDLSAKINHLYREHEFEIRTKISKAVIRGKVDLYITVDNIATQVNTAINKEVFNEYLEQIKSLGCDLSNSDVISTILKMPDVISTQKVEILENEISILNRTVDKAICEFNKFRTHEGDVIMVDILENLTTIETLLEEVKKYEVGRTEAVRERIMENYNKLNISLDKGRLEQEMIYYIEKLDITEEKVRLKKHIDYFREVCNSDDLSVGKKLGFVSQEIGREVNTLGSKSNNVEMQQIVVNMKDALEKIKEQMLNIL